MSKQINSKKVKTALVLEGGGMRGAYTAGCLSWLIDQGIEFDNAYGISTGAIHLTNYLMKHQQDLKDFATDYIADKKAVGIRSLLRTGRIVDYDYLFDKRMVTDLHFSLDDLKNSPTDSYLGLYDLAKGKTCYKPMKDADVEELKASTTLPILGKTIVHEGREILDGGITDMIPIGKAVEDGCDRFLIITTKPGDYVRKPAKPIIVWLMKKVYPQCENISRDYRDRHLNYRKQIDLIKSLEEEKKAVYIFPSHSSKATRLGGSKQDLLELYELGRSDMEQRKDEIFSLLNKNA